MFLSYYLICLAYCFFMSFRAYKNRGTDPLAITPGLDSLSFIILAPVLAPVDLFLTWVRLYTEAKRKK